MSAMVGDANIRVDPSFMAPLEGGDGDDSTVLVIAEADDSAVGQAMYRAAHRIQTMDQYGREHPNDEEFEAAIQADPNLIWPSYVHGIFRNSLGICFILDFEGGDGPAFANAAANAVAEELIRAGIREAEIRALPVGMEWGDMVVPYDS